MLPLRHLLNGLIDTYLYYSGRVDTTLPFDELRRRSLINEAAQVPVIHTLTSGADGQLRLLPPERVEIAGENEPD